VVIGVFALALRGMYRDGPLEPSSPKENGSKAVVRVLEDTGTSVDTERYTADAAQALRTGSTVVVTDTSSLGAAQLEQLSSALDEGSGHLVLIRPDFFVLRELAPDVRPSGSLTEDTQLEADASCGAASFRARAVQVGPVEDLSDAATLYTAQGEAEACFTAPTGSAVVLDDRVTVLGSSTFLANGTVDEQDNAAVALNSLGTSGAVTWYVPSPQDPLGDSRPTLLERIPDWVLPLVLWLGVVVIAVLAATGTRLGPVLVEPLPVTVRAREITIGRARLWQRSHARDRAARALRAGSASRIASRLGLRREDRLDILLDALEGRTAAPRSRLHDLLGPTPVHTDEELLRLAHDLDSLEKEIDR
jgi:hypothetical protein